MKNDPFRYLDDLLAALGGRALAAARSRGVDGYALRARLAAVQLVVCAAAVIGVLALGGLSFGSIIYAALFLAVGVLAADVARLGFSLDRIERHERHPDRRRPPRQVSGDGRSIRTAFAVVIVLGLILSTAAWIANPLPGTSMPTFANAALIVSVLLGMSIDYVAVAQERETAPRP